MSIQSCTPPSATVRHDVGAPNRGQPAPVDVRPAAAPFVRQALGPLLAFTAGYVDTAGFLTLQGLFTAHVTGNFVTIGASLLMGTSGSVSKILALAVFCAVVLAVRTLSLGLERRGHPPLRTLLRLKLLLLAAGCGIAAMGGGAVGQWCFAVPPLLSLATLILSPADRADR